MNIRDQIAAKQKTNTILLQCLVKRNIIGLSNNGHMFKDVIRNNLVYLKKLREYK